MNQQVSPVGVAVHTRGQQRGEDYGWYVKMGSIKLFSEVADLHRVALQNIEGPLPLLVLVKKERVGFLVARMPGPREDDVSRLIRDTLYLEFSSEDQTTVLTMVATLLMSSPQDYEKQYRQYFIEYAEKLNELSQQFLQNSTWSLQLLRGAQLEIKEDLTHISARLENTKELYEQYQHVLQTTVLPIMEDLPGMSAPLVRNKLVFPYGEEACQQCASYLRHFTAPGSLCFISTGQISLERCQQVAGIVDNCLIIARSSGITEVLDLNKSLKQVVIDGFTKMGDIFKRR